MKTKLTVLILCVFTFAHFANAQQYVGLDIRMPKVEKVITITADGVNLRKAPSATAPKLMRWCEGESDACGYVWSDQKQYKGALPAGADKGQYYLVVSETPEWYGVIAIEGISAYVSKKFARQVEIQPITPEMLTDVDSYGFECYQKPGITKGIYRGYAMLDINGYESNGIMFGRIVNGILVFNHHTNGVISYWEGEKRISAEIKKDPNYGEERVDIYYGPRTGIKHKSPDEEHISGYEGANVLDMDKLTTTEFAGLLENSGYKKGMTSNSGELYVCIDGEVVYLCSYDLTNPVFKTMTVPANLPKVAEIPNPNDPKPVAPYKIYKEKPQCTYAWRGLSIQEAYINQDCTILKMQFDNRLYHEEWININSNAFLKIPGTNTVAKLTKIKDISVSPAHTRIGSNEVKTFYLIFEPLPRTTTVFDFYETTSSRWKITGIRMK